MEKMMEFLTPSNLKKNSSSARGSKRSLNNIGDVKTRSSSVERVSYFFVSFTFKMLVRMLYELHVQQWLLSLNLFFSHYLY